jgi:hypothetical protein
LSLTDFISNLFGKKFLPPQKITDLPDYKTSFELAIRFTRYCGFAIKKPSWIKSDVLDPLGNFLDTTLRSSGVIDPSAAAGQCLKWCHYLQPAFEQQIGYKVWLTIGQLWKGDTQIFNPSFDDLKRWCGKGIQFADLQGRQGINLHAWLTVESGEIIEPTYLSSLAVFGGENFKQFAGATAWGRDPKVLNNLRYFPMLVGQEAVTAIAKKSVMPLLASSSSELHSLSVIMYPNINIQNF